MANVGLTKARSMGPVADAVEQAGGSVARVFRQAELPMGLIDKPEQLILLRDQLKLMECAAREIGDAALPARLSTAAGAKGLGAYGERVASRARLDEAIACGEAFMTTMLQSATRLHLNRQGRWAHWTYEITDGTGFGRQKNEILALGYMLDILRGFLGRSWVPVKASVTGLPLDAKSTIEKYLGCSLGYADIAALSFPADCLDQPNPAAQIKPDPGLCPDVPDSGDFSACVRELIRLGLMERRPQIDWVSRRLGLSRRSLQRRLGETAKTFDDMLRDVLIFEATSRLKDKQRPLTSIALDLGYSDPAHFSRAFRAWTGMSPSLWRNRALAS